MTSWLEGTPFAAIPGALAAGLVAGGLLPLLGMWVVLQRVVFLGITLAQVAAAGVALALVLDLPLLPFAMATTLLVVGVGATRRGRVTTLGDSTLGATFCAASALALLFISRSASDLDEVQHVLHGNLIYALPGDLRLMGFTLAGGVLLLGACFKELLFAAFDTETAAALGLRARLWQLLLFVVLAVSLSVSMRTTGSLLCFSMLVLPPLAALQLGRGITASFLLASALGVLGTLAGLALAVSADLHVESSITLSLFVLVPICAGWRRHAALGLLLAGLALALGALVQPAALPDSHHGHQHAPAPADTFHVDVALTATQAGDGALVVQWAATVQRGKSAEDHAPAALWLLLTGDGVFHEHLLLPHPQDLPLGESRHAGSLRLVAPGPVHRLEGQLWSGPSSALDAAPLDPGLAAAQGCDVSRT